MADRNFVLRAFVLLVLLSITLVLISGISLQAAVESVTVAMSGRSSEKPIGPHATLPAGSVVLVTGGAGFVGYHLSMRLHHDGVHVVAYDNFNPYYSPALKRARQMRLKRSGVDVVEADLCDEARLAEIIDTQHVTHVASMAAQAGVRYSLIQPQAYARSNLQCFISLLEVLRHRPSVRLVYASSSSVYGSNTKTPFAESDRTDSRAPPNLCIGPRTPVCMLLRHAAAACLLPRH